MYTSAELKEIITRHVKERGITTLIFDFMGYYECFSCNKKNIYKTNMKCCKHCLFYNTIKSEFNRKCRYLCNECYVINKQNINDGKVVNVNITYMKDGNILCNNCYINCLSCHTCFFDVENNNHFKCDACNGVFCIHCSSQSQICSNIFCDFCYNMEYLNNATSD